MSARTMRRLLRLSLVLIMLCSSAAHGQNLLANPSFTSDFSGWVNFVGDAVWDPLDANGSPSSGSALLTHDDTSTSTQVLVQCLPVAANSTFNLSGRSYVPSGQGVSGWAMVRVLWFSDDSCVDFLDTAGTNVSGLVDTWSNLWSDVLQSPTGTRSVRVTLSLGGPLGPGNEFSAHFDDIFFYEVLFIDGFESGDTTFWSATSP